MKKIWFIRHAESAANAGLPTSQPDTIPLTEKGIQQSRELAEQITEPPQLFVMSPFIRTQQTAKPTLEKFPEVPVEIWPIHEFDFLSPVQCIDTTVDERRPWVFNYWERCEANYVHGEGAESFTTFKNRVIASIKLLETSPYDFIIVFAHGHVMRAVWQYFATKNIVIDDDCMRYFRDTMTLLPVPNIAIFKATFGNNTWSMDDPAFDPRREEQRQMSTGQG
ncbi:MAG: histidine phosphatase family protein [Mucilaginibacter sp.]|nr:histidine phosphatase family protein [Mucilaginibacter sp.]